MFEAAIRVKSMHQIKLGFKTRKKGKNGNERYVYINLHLKDCLDI